MRLLLSICCFLAASTAQAQFVSLGLKGGIPVTPALPGFNETNPSVPYLDTGRWTVGPTIELHLVSGLSIEADVLFRGYTTVATYDFPTAPNSYVTQMLKDSVKAWDFPLLLKYRFPTHTIRPFVTAGAQLTHLTSDQYYSLACLSSTCVPINPNSSIPFSGHYSYIDNISGPAGGVGVEFRYGRIKFDPEVRYAHLDTDINLVTVLLGVTF
jgi:hypothetical protein